MSVTSARDRPPTESRSDRVPLWVTGVTMALLLLGFAPSRTSPPAGPNPSSHEREGRVIGLQGGRGRGRAATHPLEVPVRGWKDILLRVWKNIGKDRVIVVAAGVTFYSVLALFPAIAALVALYGLFADPTTITSHLDSTAGLIPGGAMEIIRDQITRVASQGRATLGLTFLAGLAASLWSANAGMKSLFDALNLVYNEPEKRSFVWLNIISLTFTVLTMVFALFAMGVVVVVPIVLDFMGLGAGTEMAIKIARWPALLIVITLALAVLYRYGPSREKPQWRWITWGSAVAAISWLVISVLFSWYAENFGNYNKTYGSLGAIIAFMFWIWLSIIVVLLGAELNAETEHQTARDTTTGRPKPLGSRGAKMADTVGGTQD
jgi:membrane protein